MDIEQLKLILETLRSVADTAGTAGIVWLCAHYFVLLVQSLAVPVCTAAIFIVGLKQITKAEVSKKQQASADEQERTKQAELALERTKVEAAGKQAVQQLCAIASAAGVRHSEYSGIYTTSDLDKIITKVKP